MNLTQYSIYELQTFIEKYAQAVNKPLIFFRSYGWNNSTDVDAINESMDIYRQLLPLDLFTSLHQSEFCIMEMDTIIEAEEFLLDKFPESQAQVKKEMYIHYSLYNDQGQVILSNE